MTDISQSAIPFNNTSYSQMTTPPIYSCENKRQKNFVFPYSARETNNKNMNGSELLDSTDKNAQT